MTSFTGFPELADHVAPLRYALLGLGLAWAVAAARAGRGALLALGFGFFVVGAGFWVASLARPYGLLDDPASTRRAAEVAVGAASGRLEESFVAATPTENRAYVGLLRTGASEALLSALPSLLPVFVPVLIAGLVLLLWGRREAPVAACLWLAFATGDLESARGLGLLPGAWARPEAGLALPLLAAGALALGRRGGRAGTLLAAACASLAAVTPGAARLAPADAALLVTFDQWPWLPLAVAAWLRVRDAAGLGLAVGGAAAVLSGALAGVGDGWAGVALLRLGLLLSCAAVAGPVLSRLGAAVSERSPRLRALAPERVGLALVLALAAPASFLAWWDPVRTDAVARASREPISPALEPLARFLREQTPRDAVFVASADHAPAVAVLGGRRVLRAPSLRVTGDDARRVRLEGAVLSGRSGAADTGAPDVRFVLLAPGDFKARGITRPEDLEQRPGFRLRYADPEGYRVYEVVR